MKHNARSTVDNVFKLSCHVKTSHQSVLIYIPTDHNNIPRDINNLINTFSSIINSLLYLENKKDCDSPARTGSACLSDQVEFSSKFGDEVVYMNYISLIISSS